MTQPDSGAALNESKRAIEGVKKFIYGIVILVAVIVFGFWIFDSQSEYSEQKQKHVVRLACPTYPIQSNMVETKGGDTWSRVSVPPGCDAKWFFYNEKDRDMTDVKTFPDNKSSDKNNPEKHLSDRAEALLFRSREPVTIKIEFHPLGTFAPKNM